MYIVYKGTGGLIHMLCGLVYCIVWCKNNGGKLIIDVKGHKCFQHNISDFFIINNFKNYSEDYTNIDMNLKWKRTSLQQIIDTEHVEVDRGLGNFTHFYRINNIDIRHSLDLYNYNEKLRVYAGPGSFSIQHISHFLKIKPEIVNMIKELKLIDGDYCGVHFRNTDRKNNIELFIKKIKNYPTKKIYLATDDATAYDTLVNALPNHMIMHYTNPIDMNGKPIHYMESNKYNLIISLLVDMYYLTKAKEFVDSPSSLVSRLVKCMRIKNQNIYE